MAFVFTWDATFETLPADNENASQGALRIRNLKGAISEREKVDHSWAGDANDGAHVKVTLLEQSGDPASAANTGFLYTKDVSTITELFWENSSGTVQQLTSGGSLIAQDPPGTGKDYWGSSLPAGYVWANGQTLGDASSSATGRANADTQALFTALWNASADADLPVSSGRGVSASADFSAHKTITLPDVRGRTRAGRETMGGTSGTTRLTAAVSGIDGTVFAKVGGDQNVHQHNHTLTDPHHSHTLSESGSSQGGSAVNDRSGGSFTNNTGSSATGITLANFGTGASQNVQPTIVCNYILKL